MSKLFLVMGIPGAGKSTYIKKVMGENDLYVSRDEIRFSLVAENEEYFSKEDEVFNQFVATIDEGLKENLTVWADATHLNEKARLKLLNALSETPDILDVVWIKTDLEIALRQNDLRQGTRAFVPHSVIRRMYAQMRKPKFHEGKFTINTIFVKEPDHVIKIYQEGDDIE